MTYRHGGRATQLGTFAMLFMLAGLASADNAAVTSDVQTLEARFQVELDALHDQYGFPGATAAYILPDGTTGVAATGLADVELNIPMTPQSRMLAASIGKTFVGATVLALAQEGRLRLDDPISTWLGDRPWFSRLPNHDKITLRHLLTHSAGLPDHIYLKSYQETFARRWREPGNPFPPEALVEFILDQPPLFEPGQSFAYTDTGYLLIGLIIEEVADYSFYEEVTQRFLVPLRMGLTTPSNSRILPGLAAGYLPAQNKFGLEPKTTVAPGIMVWNPAREWTGGGFVSNPRDLVIWAKALYEGRAMKADYLKELMQSVSAGEGSHARYGAGVGIHERGPLGATYGHGGGIPGYTSSMRYYPEYGVAIAFQINTDGGIATGTEFKPYYGEMQLRLAKLVTAAIQK